jgi:hypothetical protein
MKAITIHQPWASLIAVGAKRFETRSWPTMHRGPLAIHAGKQVDREICQQEPFRSVLAKHGYTADNLPTGAIVAVGNLNMCYKVVGVNETNDRAVFFGSLVINAHRGVEGDEVAFGNYLPNRYAWELTDVQQLPAPIPVKGQQGLWNWEGDPHAGQGA